MKDTGILERRALLENLQQHRMLVSIPLRTDLSVGMIIKLDISSPEVAGDGEIEDKVNDNRYLITDLSISCDPTDKTGVCYLECVKESYASKIENFKPLEQAPSAEDLD